MTMHCTAPHNFAYLASNDLPEHCDIDAAIIRELSGRVYEHGLEGDRHDADVFRMLETARLTFGMTVFSFNALSEAADDFELGVALGFMGA